MFDTFNTMELSNDIIDENIVFWHFYTFNDMIDF